MAATPQYGGMFFIGASGKTYSVDVYVSDVNGGSVRFDSGAGAGTGSSEFITFPESVVLSDFSMVTGTADTEKIRLTVGGRPTAHILRYGVHLTTIATRPALKIGFTPNARIGALQISD